MMPKRGNIEEMKKIALERGGECLSDSYINNRTKLRWVCSKKHIFYANANKIKNSGQWCPICGKERAHKSRRLTIEEMRIDANRNGGICLSEEYVNSQTLLKWRCKNGHEFKMRPNDVRSGLWCPYCSGIAKLNIEKLQKIAKDRGGRLVSEYYKNARSPLIWECSKGHKWKATASNIRRGTWCPDCNVRLNERITRNIFEKLFNKKFPKKRPAWLINPETGRKMELDGYCEDLDLAFEYQGIQHYKLFEKHFHKNRSLKKQQKNDVIKRKLCSERGVNLVEVPYTLSYDELSDYIIAQCRRYNIVLPVIDEKIHDINNFDDLYSNNDELMRIIAIAHKKDGKCLSKKYIDNKTKMSFICKNGHRWDATPNNIKSGKWCPYCAGKYQTIDDMIDLAKSYDGVCLSNEYKGNYVELKWKCKEGHIFKKKPKYVRRGSWCPICKKVQTHIKL